MPVTRCPNCRRGRAGYLDREKTLLELDLDEIRTEISKYQAKEARIRAYIAALNDRTDYPDGTGVCDIDVGMRWESVDCARF